MSVSVRLVPAILVLLGSCSDDSRVSAAEADARAARAEAAAARAAADAVKQQAEADRAKLREEVQRVSLQEQPAAPPPTVAEIPRAGSGSALAKLRSDLVDAELSLERSRSELRKCEASVAEFDAKHRATLAGYDEKIAQAEREGSPIKAEVWRAAKRTAERPAGSSAAWQRKQSAWGDVRDLEARVADLKKRIINAGG